MKTATHKLVAEVISWSMKIALEGIGPAVGFRGEKLVGNRCSWAGKRLADGWHFAYFGFKADAKARKECHFFERSYQCNKICEECLAERSNKHGDPLMLFKNFFDGAAYWMTLLSHSDYVRSSTTPSPWLAMPGFHFKTAFRDPMHTIYLGTAKEMLASCLGYWSRLGHLPGENLQQQLRAFSRIQKYICRQEGMHTNFKTFTPSNTGLDKPSEYPELGSSFKAASVKQSIFFFAKYATELASTTEENYEGFPEFAGWILGVLKLKVFRGGNSSLTLQEDINLRLIAMSLWSLQEALHILDHSGLIVLKEDAEVGVCENTQFTVR